MPNIAVTQEDEDEFEEDPDAYIRNDLEEADLETRRRNCLKFVQTLSRHYSNEISGLINDYVNTFLQEYGSNREANWRKKTSILNLLIAVTVQHYSIRLGVVDLTVPEE